MTSTARLALTVALCSSFAARPWAQVPQQSPPQTNAVGTVKPDDVWPPAGVYRGDDVGVVRPRLVTSVQPKYTADAMRQKLQGVAVLSGVIEIDGTVGPVRIIQSVDAASGLDDSAIAAAKHWRFVPAMRDGAPVRVVVPLQLVFQIRDLAPSESRPAGFADAALASLETSAWSVKTSDRDGLHIQLRHPPTWTAAPESATNLMWLDLRHMDSGGMWGIGVFAPLQVPGPLELPLPLSRLQQFADGMRSRLANRVELTAFGQFQSAGRWWMWLDGAGLMPDAAQAPPGAQASIQTFDGIRQWVFVSFVAKKQVVVAATVMFRRGATPDERANELKFASADIAAMLRLIDIHPQ